MNVIVWSSIKIFCCFQELAFYIANQSSNRPISSHSCRHCPWMYGFIWLRHTLVYPSYYLSWQGMCWILLHKIKHKVPLTLLLDCTLCLPKLFYVKCKWPALLRADQSSYLSPQHAGLARCFFPTGRWNGLLLIGQRDKQCQYKHTTILSLSTEQQIQTTIFFSNTFQRYFFPFCWLYLFNYFALCILSSY